MPRFALIANCQHKNNLNPRNVPVQGNISARIAAHDKFPAVRTDRMTHQGVLFKHIDGQKNFFYSRWRIDRIVFKQMFEDAVEVLADLGCKLDSSLRAPSFVVLGGQRGRPLAVS